MTDKQNGRSKGYGFVSYDNANAAEEAIKKVNGKQALGKRLKVELKKGGIAAHLGDVSLSKEDRLMVRNNMSESEENNSNLLMNSFQQHLSQDSLSFDTIKGSQAFSQLANNQLSIGSHHT